MAEEYSVLETGIRLTQPNGARCRAQCTLVIDKRQGGLWVNLGGATARKLPNQLCLSSPLNVVNTELETRCEENQVSCSTSVAARRDTGIYPHPVIISIIEFGRLCLRVRCQEF